MTEEETIAGCLRKAEEEGKKQKVQAIIQQMKHDIRAGEIFEDMKNRIYPETIQKLRDQVARETLGIGDPQQIETEVNERLRKMLAADIEEKLKSSTKMEEPDSHSMNRKLTYLRDETLADIRVVTAVIRDRFSLNELLLDKTAVNILQSSLASWNQDVQNLRTTGTEYATLEPVPFPLELPELSQWIQNIKAGKILNQEFLEQMRDTLNRLLR